MRCSLVRCFRAIGIVCLFVHGGLLLGQSAPTPNKNLRSVSHDKLIEHWAIVSASDNSSFERSQANKEFIPMLARALTKDKDLSTKFSSLLSGLFEIYPPDSSFRILTWELLVTDNHVRHFGVVQRKKKHLTLLPLFDASDMHAYRTKEVLSRNDWFGQIYYDVYPFGEPQSGRYLLMGHDSKDSLSDFKILDVLTFRDEEVFFGAPLFIYPPDMPTVSAGDVISQDSLTTRLFFEHKEGTIVKLSAEPSANEVRYSHLSPIHPSAKETLYNYVPDGTDAGYHWNGIYWEWLPEPSAILTTD